MDTMCLENRLERLQTIVSQHIQCRCEKRYLKLTRYPSMDDTVGVKNRYICKSSYAQIACDNSVSFTRCDENAFSLQFISGWIILLMGFGKVAVLCKC